MFKYLMLAFVVPGGLAIIAGVLIYKIIKKKKKEEKPEAAGELPMGEDIPMMGGLAADIGLLKTDADVLSAYYDTAVSKKTVTKKKTTKRTKKILNKKKTSKK